MSYPTVLSLFEWSYSMWWYIFICAGIVIQRYPVILFQRTGNYISSEGPSRLPKSVLEYKMLSDLNRATYAEGAIIKGVEFNPIFQVALVAGFSKTNGSATLFQVCNLL